MKKTLALFAFLYFFCAAICGQNIKPSFDGPSRPLEYQREKPTFPGCEDIVDKKERLKCADEKMLQFVYGNMKYPAEARRDGIEGMVIIKFFIDEDGSILDTEIGRDIGGGCGEEALRVVESMPNWNPSRIDGNPIGVSFTLPVRFKLGKYKKN